MKTRPVWAKLFHADGRTDRKTHMTKVTLAFRNAANAPNKRKDNFPFRLNCYQIPTVIYVSPGQFDQLQLWKLKNC